MKEQIISFETAKLAKEKGFESILLSYYESDSKKLIINKVHVARTLESLKGSPYGQNTIDDYKAVLSVMDNSIDEFILAPTQSLLQKWLREIYQTDITVITNWSFGIRTYRVGSSYILNNKVEIWFSKKEDKVSFIEYNTYEEALEAGLQEALKLIENESTNN